LPRSPAEGRRQRTAVSGTASSPPRGGVAARLDYREGDAQDEDRYYDEMDDVTRQLRVEVDAYIEQVVDPRDAPSQIAGRLQRLLRRAPHPDYGDGPFAEASDFAAGHALTIAYTIVRRPHHDSAAIRGYLEKAGRFELTATAGEDFAGFNMFRRELSSRIPGELWLMAWGQAHTANGSIVRLRVYAFDGRAFRTVWSPEDLFNARVTFHDRGFAIDHYQRPHDVRDEYLVTPDGVIGVP
jgi:hypothetical protein